MPERVEVELTPTGGSTRRRRGGHEVALEPGPPGPIEAGADVATERFVGVPDVVAVPGPESAPGRGRLVGVVAVVGVLALAIGFVLGRSGGADETAEPAPATTVAAATASTGEPLPTVSETAPATTRPARSSAIVPAITAPEVDPDPPIEIAERLVGEPYEIVTLAPGRELLEIDLLAGFVETRRYDQVLFGQPTLYVGDEWALIVSAFEASPGALFEGDADARPVDEFKGNESLVLGLSGLDRLWWLEDGYDPSGGVATEVDPTGEPTGRSIEVPTVPRAMDPRGGLVVEVAGGAFAISPEGQAARITTGRLLALSAGSALAHECDDTLQCRYVVIDRDSGERSVVPVPDELHGSTELWGSEWWNVSAPMAPDDSAVALLWHRPDSSMLVVLELITGDLVELAQGHGPMLATWSPDGAYLFYLDGTRLRAWERATGEVFDVVDVPVELGVGVRPSSVSPAVGTAVEGSTTK